MSAVEDKSTGARGSAQIAFEDNKGNTMQLAGSLTIGDLVKTGVREIRLMPEGSPPPDGWWRDKYAPNAGDVPRAQNT